MKHDEQQIRQLIERFLEGVTSNSEEQMLYDYFRRDVPRSLRKYQPMFRWYADGMPEREPKRRSMWPRLAVAASLSAAIGGGVVYFNREQVDEHLAQYEGSYIVRNGQKITDLQKIMPDLLRVQAKAEQRQQRIEQRLNGERQSEDNLPTI